MTAQASDTFRGALLQPGIGGAFCGHATIATATRERLANLDSDFAPLRALMTARDWVTIALVFRRDQTSLTTP